MFPKKLNQKQLLIAGGTALIILVAGFILWQFTGTPTTYVDADQTFTEDYMISVGERVVVRNGATLTFEKNLTVKGSLLCEGGPLKLIVNGKLTIERHVQCDLSDDLTGNESGNGILIAAKSADITKDAVIVSNGNIQVVSSADKFATTKEAVQNLYNEAGVWTNDKVNIGPFIPFNEIPKGVKGLPTSLRVPLPTESTSQNKLGLLVNTAYAQEAEPAVDNEGNPVANAWRIRGKWYVGADPAFPPPFDLTIPTPPPGVDKIILNFDFSDGNGGVEIADFDLTGPNGRAGKLGEESCNSQGGKGEDAMRFNVRARGNVTMNNFNIHLGAGGEGGRAETSKNCDPGIATGGQGGQSGNIKIVSDNGIDIAGEFNIYPGLGGKGGEAIAHGKKGDDGCPGEKGGDATATGGKGGDNKKGLMVAGAVGGTENVTINEIIGGDGGNAIANGGDGGNGNGPDCDGGAGGKATATGGKGGDAQSVKATSTGGNGGNSTAKPGKGGNGGNGSATERGGNGGNGGDAKGTKGIAGVGTTNSGVDGAVLEEKGGDGGNGGDGCPPGGGGNGGNGNPVGNKGEDGKNLCVGEEAPPVTDPTPPPPPPTDSFFDVFFDITTHNFTHTIGSSPCPQAVGTTKIVVEGTAPTGLKAKVVGALPNWLAVSPNGTIFNFQFTCNIDTFESQTLNTTVKVQAQDGTGRVLEDVNVTVRGNIIAN